LSPPAPAPPTPKPCQHPHPPLWIGGWGEITLRRAATLADNWIPGPTADLKRLLAGKKPFLANRATAGPDGPHHRLAAHARRHHRRHGPAGARAGRGSHHGRLPQGVRRRVA